MKQFIFILLAIIIVSIVECDNQITYLKANPIQINEELEPDSQIANLTQLIYSLLVNITDINLSQIQINTVQLQDNNNDENDYFRLETRQISIGNLLIKSIDLKSGSKRIDREQLCPLLRQQQRLCEINLKLIADLNTSELGIEVPIIINDLNDNKPAFYQSEIKIEIDLNNNYNNNNKEQMRIPFKLAYDLDSTPINRIHNYTLVHLTQNNSSIKGYNLTSLNLIQIKFTQRIAKPDALFLILNNSTDLDTYVNPTELFELKATDPDFNAKQLIEIKFIKQIKHLDFHLFQSSVYNNLTVNSTSRISLSLLNQECETLTFQAFSNNKQIKANFKLENNNLLEIFIQNMLKLKQIKLVAKCGLDLNDTTLIMLNNNEDNNSSLFSFNLISAMNDLDITESDNIFQFKFKNTEITNFNASFVTLVYLIAEQQQQHQQQKHGGVKFKLDSNNMNIYQDLIRIDEMRNGLYAFKISSKYLDLFKKMNSNDEEEQTNLLKIKLNLQIMNPTDLTLINKMERVIKLKMPSIHLIQTTMNLPRADLSLNTIKSTSILTSSMPSVTAASLLANFNLFNSIVLITAISGFLILIALLCFIVSLVLYLKSKCKKQHQNTNNDNDSTSKNDSVIKIKLEDNNSNNFFKLSNGSTSIELGESGISSGQPSTSSSASDLSCNLDILRKKSKNFNDSSTIKAGGNNAIMVYDVMPSKQLKYLTNNPPISSSSSSSSSSSYHQNSSDTALSNVSPITTTSGVESAMSNSSSKQQQQQSLLKLSAKNLDSDMYKWYMNNNESDLIRPLPIKPTNQQQQEQKSDSSLNLNKEYRNEIYRNSHLIFKNQQQQQYCQLKKSILSNNNEQIDNNLSITVPTTSIFRTYEAKPVNLETNNNNNNNNFNYSYIATPTPTQTITITNSNINSSSSLDNYDTVNFDSLSSNSINLNNNKMANRLSKAISVVTSNSSSSSSSNHENNNKIINNFSIVDSEQVSSV